jgi:leucyl-tRNA---protein transferase
MDQLPGSSSESRPLPPPVAIDLVVLPENPCPYLPDRLARNRAFRAQRIPGQVYHAFMDAGFRRSGKVIYQPMCNGCRACMPIRVPVERFQPSKSQRRCWRANLDLKVITGPPTPAEEKFELYQRYQRDWHARPAAEDDRESFEMFLYDSPVESIEFCYRDNNNRLLAVGICDVCDRSLSSVYFYFDPSISSRGLGTFGAMYEIEWARLQGIPYYYLGYWISGSPTMQYKSSFRPCEILHEDGCWREFTPL